MESSSIGGIDENLTNSNLLVSDENEPKPPTSVLWIKCIPTFTIPCYHPDKVNVKRAAISTFRNMSGDQQEVKRKKTTAGSLGNMIHSSFLQLECFLVHKTELDSGSRRMKGGGDFWVTWPSLTAPGPPHPFLSSFASPTSYSARFAINKKNICLLA